jgi:hypothetical protein
MPEHFHEGGQPLLAVGVNVETGIVEEAGAGPQADAASRMLREITSGAR